MNTPFDPKVQTPEDLLNYFSTLVKGDQDTCMLSMDLCIAARHILQDQERERQLTEMRLRNMGQTLEENDEMYRNMLSFFTDLIADADPEVPVRKAADARGLMVSVKQFKGALDKAGEHDLVETAFKKLKGAVVSETRNNTRKIDRGRLLGLMGKWLRLPEKDTLEDNYLTLFVHCKESYLKITHELRGVLSSVHNKKIRQVETEIDSAQNLTEFSRLRGQVMDLLQEYLAESANDKAQAVSFAEEISQRILGMDKKIANSMDAFQEIQERNKAFNEQLSENIQSLKDSLTIGASMKELTQVMNNKISLLSETLNRKKARDYSEEQRLKKQVNILKTAMKRIRDDFNESRKKNKKLEFELNTDHLTGAANRRAYEATAAKEMQRFIRYNRTFSIIIFDVDRFKSINDTYGHAIGDKCLIEITSRIKGVLRITDILARTGGDEFVVIMPETNTGQARGVAEKIRRLIGHTEFVYKKDRVHVSLSLGVAHATESDKGYDSIFNRADKALYQAKERGRNRVGVMA